MWQDSFGLNKWGLVYKISRSYIRSHFVISPWLLPNSINFQTSVGISGTLFSDNPYLLDFHVRIPFNQAIEMWHFQRNQGSSWVDQWSCSISSPYGGYSRYSTTASHLKLLKLASSVSAMCISWLKSWLYRVIPWLYDALWCYIPSFSHHSHFHAIIISGFTEGSLTFPEVLASSRALRRFVTGGVSGRPAPSVGSWGGWGWTRHEKPTLALGYPLVNIQKTMENHHF